MQQSVRWGLLWGLEGWGEGAGLSSPAPTLHSGPLPAGEWQVAFTPGDLQSSCLSGEEKAG